MFDIRVTVGMVVRNSEETIKDAIQTVMNQDFCHDSMELLVVDGSSQDATLSILKDCLDNIDIKSKVFSENHGLGYARQIVVDNAQGDYIIWVDGDMILSTDFMSKQVEFMENNPDVGVAKGYYELSKGPNILSTLEIYSRAAAKFGDYRSHKARSKALGTSGCIYRLKAIKDVGGFDKKISGYGEDWDAEYRIRLAGWSLCVCKVPYQDYERVGLSWKKLFSRYQKRGYDLYDLMKKHDGVIKLYGMLPLMALVVGVFASFKLFKITGEKVVFLLPFFYPIKMVFWWIGYFKRFFEKLVFL